MKPKNAKQAEELLETYRELKQMEEELSEYMPGEIEGLLLKHKNQDCYYMFLDSLTVGSLEKIQGYVLGVIQDEIEQIEEELEKL